LSRREKAYGEKKEILPDRKSPGWPEKMDGIFMRQSAGHFLSRRLLISMLVLGLIGISLWAIWFFRQKLRGLSPVVFGPAGNVVALVSQGNGVLNYPPEFSLSIFAEGLDGPRVLTVDPAGTLLVSLPAAGKVVALPDGDGNGRADRVVEVIGGLKRPHGLAFAPGADRRLFVAETDRVMAYEYDPVTMQAGPGAEIAGLPGGGRHFSRSLLFMPPPDEDKLLISVGSSCDTCVEEDWRRAKILVLDPDGGEPRIFAAGLRNAVFMTLHPATGEIWATEMGRDHLGDNLPPDEINIIKAGRDYGWPSCYGNNTADGEFLGPGAISGACLTKTPSFIDLPAHSAPLGLAFFPARGGWPEKYRGNLLVAYHGSWNRTMPTGYKIVLFRFDRQGKLLGREDFISGWLLPDNTSLGRPVDIRIMEDRIFISDDKAGVIYQLTMRGNP